MDSHSDESDPPADGALPKEKRKSRLFKNQAWSSTGKFLTRENIINMCTGNEAQSSQAPDNSMHEKSASTAATASLKSEIKILKGVIEAPVKRKV